MLARVPGPSACLLPKRDLQKRNLLYPPGERFPVTQTCKQVAETGAGDPRQGRPCKQCALTLLCSPWCSWGKEYRWSPQQSSQATMSRLYLPLEIAVKICRDVARLRASGLHLTNLPPFTIPPTHTTPSSTLPGSKLSRNSKLKSQHHPSPAAPGHCQTPICYRSHLGLHLQQISTGRWTSYLKDSTRLIGWLKLPRRGGLECGRSRAKLSWTVSRSLNSPSLPTSCLT